ncbi:hypothetical protein [Hymenobacter sp. BT559]|uniref:hypothetical protein n=1 Tax=Hymenobacter sp. BT559 TaxID=2795729 RepID=UPI0018ECDBD9|nr:hypothetical protein [Hymenobacter sp. BT559]MBJ6144438.1 hypothetical protein [Hymenobacter sp. BT559]
MWLVKGPVVSPFKQGAAGGWVQTTPAASASAGTPAVSGTKNVGRNRTDAPKAPGMSPTGPSRETPARARRAITRRGPAASAKAPAALASAQ